MFSNYVNSKLKMKLTSPPTILSNPRNLCTLHHIPTLTDSISLPSPVYSAPADLPHTWLLTMETMFSALGLCQKVEEHMMNVHSAAFSSGPAYVAAFIDALATGAANHGVRWEDAVQMAAQVVSARDGRERGPGLGGFGTVWVGYRGVCLDA